jgi:tetratricopeptide (TPR) repeat protein
VRLGRALAQAAEAAMTTWNPKEANQLLAEAINIFSLNENNLDLKDRTYLLALTAAHMRWKGELEDAKKMGEAALRSVHSVDKPDPVILARVLLNNGLIYSAAGEAQKALDHFTSAHNLFVEIYGPSHFYSLDAARQLALKNLNFDNIEVARAQIEEVLRFAEQAYGSETLYFAGWMVDYASVLMDANRYEEALALLKRAELIAGKSLSVRHLSMAYGFELIAQCHAAMSQHDQELIYRRKAYLAYES